MDRFFETVWFLKNREMSKNFRATLGQLCKHISYIAIVFTTPRSMQHIESLQAIDTVWLLHRVTV